MPRAHEARILTPAASLSADTTLLWSKPLPGGANFDLDDTRPGAYLYHGSTLGQSFLSSDTVIPSFTRWGFAAAHPLLITAVQNEAFMAIRFLRDVLHSVR
jgi:hypothetical protein